MMLVASAARELLELFKRAAIAPVVIVPTGDDLEAKRRASQRLSYRLNSLRVAMRREKHVLTTIANSVEFSIDRRTAVLTCRPADHNFLDALATAGISIADPDGIEGIEGVDTPDEAASLASRHRRLRM